MLLGFSLMCIDQQIANNWSFVAYKRLGRGKWRGGAVFVAYNGVKQNQNKLDCPFIDLLEESSSVWLSLYMVFTYFHANQPLDLVFPNPSC